jgi:tetratricopeptide (TPR) repeat protein/tRNA A-37 threonylcarbamoyl transferase component Bud32
MAAIPQKIGKYQIESVLGRGGMGEVYKAHDANLGRFVALKVMRGPALDDTNARERFIREAQSAGGLRHPNIVTVYDLGEFEDRMFIAMEFIHGEDLEHLIKKKAPLTLDDKFNILVQVCEGMAYAHKNQIVHRDLKPSNIRIDEQGIAKIMDFGIAKLESSNMTASGTVMGTPYYMSPEQVRGMRVDQRSDVFSLGAILYELFAYKKAFEGELATVFFKIVHEQPQPIAGLLSVPSEPVQKIIDGCLEKDKVKRIQTVHELLDGLRSSHQWYMQNGLLQSTGLETDSQGAISTFRMAPAPAAVKPRTGTHPHGAAPTELLSAQPTVHHDAASSAPTAMLHPGTNQDAPPPLDPTVRPFTPPGAPPMPTVVDTVPKPASSNKAAWIVSAVLGVLLASAIGGYFVFFRDPEKKIPETKVDIPEETKKSTDPSIENVRVTSFTSEIASAKTLHQNGQYDEAVAIYNDVLLKNPSDPQVYYLMGASKKALGKSQEALLAFQKTVELDEKHQQAWEQIGDLLMNRMDYRGAENAYLKSSALNPKSPPSWEGLAQTYLYQQKASQAETAYEKLLELEPDNVPAIYNLGVIQHQGNKNDAAKESFKRVISLNPNYAEAYNNLGGIYLIEGKVDQSIQENEKAIQLKPGLATAHYSLFTAYELKKNYPRAVEHLKQYMQITGDDDPELMQKMQQYTQ